MALTPFGDYSECYNAIYQDKDYQGEAGFVLRRLARHKPKYGSLLELGCGTGAYTQLFAPRFDSVLGVDISRAMLDEAEKKRRELAPSLRNRISYRHRDIRALNLKPGFDVALALFHVMSYQVENDDLARTFAGAQRALKKGGLFFFDFWSGPGVLRKLPEKRVKRVESGTLQVVRRAAPEIDFNRNLVLVNYRIEARSKGERRVRTFREQHAMRYLFLPELRELCARHHFECIEFGEWLSARRPTDCTWLAYLIARKTK